MTKSSIKQAVARIDWLITKVEKIKDQNGEQTFGYFVLLDESHWGLMYTKNCLNSLIADIDIASYKANEEAKSNKEKKPQVRRRASLGNSNRINKSNHRVGCKTKGV